MNRIKKAVFGVLVAGLAFGFSAFTTLKRQDVFYYYKTDMTYPEPNDPRGYTYYTSDRCEAVGNLCSAQWDIGTHIQPATDGTPLPTTGVIYQTASKINGHFE